MPTTDRPLIRLRLLPAGCLGFSSRRAGCEIETTASAAAQLLGAGHAELVIPADGRLLVRLVALRAVSRIPPQ